MRGVSAACDSARSRGYSSKSFWYQRPPKRSISSKTSGFLLLFQKIRPKSSKSDLGKMSSFMHFSRELK